jgi:DNA-binding NarL/FixJ family response regulator
MLAANPPIPELTPRQKKILEAMTRGLTDRDIATLLGIRLDGVNDHVSAILHKIDAANRTEAVAIALRKHLV